MLGGFPLLGATKKLGNRTEPLVGRGGVVFPASNFRNPRIRNFRNGLGNLFPFPLPFLKSGFNFSKKIVAHVKSLKVLRIVKAKLCACQVVICST